MMLKEDWFKKSVIYSTALISCIISIFPLVWMMFTSLKSNVTLFLYPPNLLPDFSAEQYSRLLAHTDFLSYAVNSVVILVGAIMLCLFASTLAAYSMARFGLKWRGLMAYFILFLYFLPPIMLVIPLFVLFQQFGMVNTLPGIVLGHTSYSLPFSLWLLWLFMRSIPFEYDEAAMLDGASRLQVFRHIVLPLSGPGIMAAIIFTFAVSWNDFLFAFTLLTSEDHWTLNLFIASQAGTEVADWGQLMAASTLTTLPLLFIINYIHKYLLTGFGFFGIKR